MADVHNRTVEHGPGRDKPVVNAAEDRDDRFFCALIGDIHDDRVHLLQLRLSLDQFLQGAAGNRDLRAFVPRQGPAVRAFQSRHPWSI